MRTAENTNTNSFSPSKNLSVNTRESSWYKAKTGSVTDIVEARNLLASGWEYKTSYPATISNIPHYILVKRE